MEKLFTHIYKVSSCDRKGEGNLDNYQLLYFHSCVVGFDKYSYLILSSYWGGQHILLF